MRISKICIQLVLSISLILLFLSISVYSQQEDQVREEEREENCSQLQLHSKLSAQKDDTALKVREAANLVEEKGEEAFPEFREKDSKWLYDGFYIFVWNINGTRVVYPPNLTGEGQDVSGLTDFNGKPIGKLFIETALSESGEGWISYEWPKPNETEPFTKYGFIKKAAFGEETYLVGSGFYVEDYLFTRNTGNCEFINATGISLCELMHPERMESDPGINYSIAYVVMDPGEKSLPHRLSNPEIYYTLEGNGTIFVDDVPVSLHKGKLVLVPASEVQYVENTGNSSLLLLVIDQPAWKAENEEIVG
ncbi:cache domain-containing protein [Methanosarcina sp.]|uniref:cache domain-containing protein n=1 Tax=Methanosarcina sp. TaxID=2213 RepID=UPI002AB914DA|nr:cache domain-containing protein [Methanosarcina sp.]MDY9926206.1 cache domain-containing protein [Methanosarcina sp.]